MKLRKLETFKIIALLSLIFSSCSVVDVKRNTLLRRKSALKKKKFFFIKKNAEILSLYNSSPIGGDLLSKYATESLRIGMIKSDRFIFKPELKDSFITSKQVLTSGGSRWPMILNKGSENQLNTIVYGEIKDAFVRKKIDDMGLAKEVFLLAGVKVEIRVIDVESEIEIGKKEIESFVEDKSFEIIGLERKTILAKRNSLLNRAIDLAIPKMVSFIGEHQASKSWVGKIARVEGGDFYLNAGKKNGIKVGDILKVVLDGKKVFDPNSGAYLGKSKGVIKATVEVVEFFGANGAIARLHSGGQPAVGDKVMLY
jgi:hypothetical protein